MLGFLFLVIKKEMKILADTDVESPGIQDPSHHVFKKIQGLYFLKASSTPIFNQNPFLP